jgi:hypothetical protein
MRCHTSKKILEEDENHGMENEGASYFGCEGLEQGEQVGVAT